ncbi:DUF1049 domain-containing protein [Corynebacterium sp. 320]|uniref:LapA family protein n=1 Tax=Corynebacterium TaxID=1716 RepID=UPI00125CC058|nr:MULTISPECIES: lipopolysaccharide assembly protein LapA domain-containing protein [Corynebacterium]KAB1503812.1 DUF1049 domain-containing protein [Corynebacterium sp. 320]KAB1553089.1 DUF1049 domain-containing protein [Corynebacterium sp. 321]KAB1553693.1 DUF1049 domain-containing protein [Corynebacterium sp. 319]KAB3527948.1 DUF1049 domain-containing protein [Corynebacterium sp. 250]KAB3540564.1 DUF1049 domain-containing protein [Corynebacterium sp. 366]
MTNQHPQPNESTDPFAEFPQETTPVDTPSFEPQETPVQETTPEVERTIAGSTWVALILGIFLLIVLLVFILQNQQSAQITFFAWNLNFPIGVGMLLAAIIGALVMALVGGVRIMQLRRQVTRR